MARLAKVVFGIITATVLVACGWLLKGIAPATGAGDAASAKKTLPAVAVETVKLERLNPPTEYVGHVEPVQQVDILPQIDGYLRQVKFAEGDEVKTGALLFEIDPERYAAADAVARAEKAQADSKVAECEAAVERSERYMRRLAAADERGITQTEKDAAEMGLAADRAALASAKAAVSQAEAKIRQTSFELRHTKIYAPISGRIGKALMHSGDYVAPSKGALARIVQMDPMRVTFPMSDRDLLMWQHRIADAGGSVANLERPRVRLRLTDGSIYAQEGSWDFADNEMSAETATLTVRASFPNPSRMLVPNAYVTILSDDVNPPEVPTVPFLAIVKQGMRSGVWKIVDGSARFAEVKVGRREGGRVAVLRGVKAGDTVVVQGVHKLGNGMKVQIVPASEFH